MTRLCCVHLDNTVFTLSVSFRDIAPFQLRTAENSVPMEKGVSGALQPVSINEGDRIVCVADVLRHFRSQVSSRPLIRSQRKTRLLTTRQFNGVLCFRCTEAQKRAVQGPVVGFLM